MLRRRGLLRRAAGAALALAPLLHAACTGSSSTSCEDDPACDVSLSMEFLSGPLLDGTRTFTVQVGADSVVVQCELVRADAVAECVEIERSGLDGWIVEVRVERPPENATSFTLTIDRGQDVDTAGPSRISVGVDGPGGSWTHIFGATRQVVDIDGDRCSWCSFESPDPVWIP